ncbi:MAG: hypothetical protein KDD50_00135, partial [Bdellovibrionales bacterium]|nr:hypothetical protein [Bdellovibrionales bacterium]
GLPVDLGPVTITEEPSSDEKNQIEWAGKINYTNSKLDLGLAFFMGRQRSPYILSDTPSSLSAVHFSYPKITMLGLEFERPFSNWVFRMDSALISGENTDQFNLNSINPYVETSFALESKINTSFRAIVYPILKNFINFKTQEEVSTSSDYNAIEKQLYLFNRIINGYQYKDQNSMGLRLSYESESLSHTASIFYLKNFTTEESYLQWDYKYVLNDSLELGVGVLNYEGSDQTRFGLLAEKSSYFSKITYWF